ANSRQAGTVGSRHRDLRLLFSLAMKQKSDNNLWYTTTTAPMPPHSGAIEAVPLRFPLDGQRSRWRRSSRFTKLTLPVGMILSACSRVAVDQNPAGAWSGEPGQKPRRVQTGKRR